MDRSVYDHMDRIEAEHWWFVARRDILQTTIRRLIRLPGPASILEAGCGTGGNMAMLSGFGHLDAFEADDAARRRASCKSGRDIAAGALPNALPETRRRYDLIALFDVLEHVEQDRASLRALAGLLTSEGRILLSVPACQWLWSRHDERHHHVRRYTRRTLRQTAQDAGLEVEHAFYFNTLLFPLAVTIRALKSTLGSEAPDDDMPGPHVNRLLRAVFRTERHLVGRIAMPFGLSLCAVLKPDPQA